MKKILFVLLLLTATSSIGQVYDNEFVVKEFNHVTYGTSTQDSIVSTWADENYVFKIGPDTLLIIYEDGDFSSLFELVGRLEYYSITDTLHGFVVGDFKDGWTDQIYTITFMRNNLVLTWDDIDGIWVTVFSIRTKNTYKDE